MVAGSASRTSGIRSATDPVSETRSASLAAVIWRQPASRCERGVANHQLQIVGDDRIARVAQPGRANEAHRCAVDGRVGQAKIEIGGCVSDIVELACGFSVQRNGSAQTTLSGCPVRLTSFARFVGIERGIGRKRARVGDVRRELEPCRAQLRCATCQLERVSDGLDVYPRGTNIVSLPHELRELHEALHFGRREGAIGSTRRSNLASIGRFAVSDAESVRLFALHACRESSGREWRRCQWLRVRPLPAAD